MTPAEKRAAWLASLKVGDKIAWVQHGRVRSIHVLVRETPKHWAINDGGWLVSKRHGCSVNHLSGICFEPYEQGMEQRIARQRRAEERDDERRELLRRIAGFSLKRLRTIVTGSAA
jgi:hypothetical protein